LKYFLGFPFMGLRKARFNRFYKKNLKYTGKIYKSADEANELNRYYDKFIVGSDQVWNYKNNGGDFAFLLNFVDDDAKKISYSSSFGTLEIPLELKYQYVKYLSKINKIAVRETYGVNLVKQLTGRDAKLVLDPVFLLSKQQWESLVPQDKIKEPYVFFYTNRDNQISEFFKQTNFELKGRKLYKLTRSTSIGDLLNYNIKVKYTMSPYEFIRVIRDSELVVSASFHCISLAIILNKPFVAILTGDQGKDERISNILHLLDLDNRILTTKMGENEIYNHINFDKVNYKIQDFAMASKLYLMESINA